MANHDIRYSSHDATSAGPSNYTYGGRDLDDLSESMDRLQMAGQEPQAGIKGIQQAYDPLTGVMSRSATLGENHKALLGTPGEIERIDPCESVSLHVWNAALRSDDEQHIADGPSLANSSPSARCSSFCGRSQRVMALQMAPIYPA